MTSQLRTGDWSWANDVYICTKRHRFSLYSSHETVISSRTDHRRGTNRHIVTSSRARPRAARRNERERNEERERKGERERERNALPRRDASPAKRQTAVSSPSSGPCTFILSINHQVAAAVCHISDWLLSCSHQHFCVVGDRASCVQYLCFTPEVIT